MTTENNEQTVAAAAQPTITLNLTVQEVNVIIAALQEMPFKVADPVLKNLVPQAQQSLDAFKASQSAESAAQ